MDHVVENGDSAVVVENGDGSDLAVRSLLERGLEPGDKEDFFSKKLTIPTKVTGSRKRKQSTPVKFVRESKQRQKSSSTGVTSTTPACSFDPDVITQLQKNSTNLPIGHDAFKLKSDRVDVARLSSEFKSVVVGEGLGGWSSFARVDRFIETLSDNNDATVFQYLLWCACRAIHEPKIDPFDPPASMLELFDLFVRFEELARPVTFEAESHTYTVKGAGKMRMSVTKALDLVFGTFDPDLVSRCMIKSCRWKTGAYYKELAFDETGRERDEETIVRLLKASWNDKRKKGTQLHEYIHSSAVASMKSVYGPAGDERDALEEDVKDEDVKEKERVDTAAIERGRFDDTRRPSWIDDTRRPGPSDNVGRSYDVLVSTKIDEQSLIHRRWRTFVLTNCFDTDKRLRPFVEILSSSSRMRDNAVNDSVVERSNVTAYERFNARRIHDGWLLLASEYSVYDREASLGGSIDAVYVMYPDRTPGILAIVDWKRCPIQLANWSKHVNNYVSHLPKCNFSKYSMQVNVYREMLERMLKGTAIVSLMYLVSIQEGRTVPEMYSVARCSDVQLFLDELRARNC